MEENLNVRRVMFLGLLCVVACSVHANSGAFMNAGDNLLPLETTQVELRREVLEFHVHRIDNDPGAPGVVVNVLFEFFNPAELEVVTVGFVTPVSAFRPPAELQNLSISVNDTDVAPTFSQATTVTAGANPSIDEDDLVYVFDAEFPAGVTTMRVEYHISGWHDGANCWRMRGAPYRLSTGTTWANGQINDFTLVVRTEEPEIFMVPNDLGQGWLGFEVEGNGRTVAGAIVPSFAQGSVRSTGDEPLTVYLDGGQLVGRATNFVPEHDMTILRFSPISDRIFYSWAASPAVRDEIWSLAFFRVVWCAEADRSMESLRSLDLTAAELRIFRNILFAKHGYVFQSADLRAIFEPLVWYLPDPNVLGTAEILNAEDRELLENIRALERELAASGS